MSHSMGMALEVYKNSLQQAGVKRGDESYPIINIAGMNSAL